MSFEKANRKFAVPMRGSIWGMNYNDKSDKNLGYQVANNVPVTNSDFDDFFPGVIKGVSGVESSKTPLIGASMQCPLRILQPQCGGIVLCAADLQITVASADSDLTLKLAVGRFQNSQYDRIMTYPSAEIDASWQKIHGTTTPLAVSGGVISASMIDLTPALPQYSDGSFMQEAFVLVLAFNKVPTITGTFNFDFLNVYTSIEGVV